MKLVIRIVTFYIMLRCSHSHFEYGDYYKNHSPDVAFQSLPQDDYINNPELYPLVPNNYNFVPEECVCSCDICYTNPKQCCMQYCRKCAEESNRPGLMYVPYPYYIFNSPSPAITEPTQLQTTITTTTTQATTTTTVAETIVEPSPIARMDNEALSEDALRDSYIKELLENTKPDKNDNDKVILTSLRRTKPRWMPKFGIVPIPDQLAEKLMLKIRNMKVLHPEKDTVRRIESMYPRYK